MNYNQYEGKEVNLNAIETRMRLEGFTETNRTQSSIRFFKLDEDLTTKTVIFKFKPRFSEETPYIFIEGVEIKTKMNNSFVSAIAFSVLVTIIFIMLHCYHIGYKQTSSIENINLNNFIEEYNSISDLKLNDLNCKKTKFNGYTDNRYSFEDTEVFIKSKDNKLYSIDIVCLGDVNTFYAITRYIVQSVYKDNETALYNVDALITSSLKDDEKAYNQADFENKILKLSSFNSVSAFEITFK